MLYPIICILCYLSAAILRKTKLPNELLPLFCLLLGAALGALSSTDLFLTLFPNISASDDFLLLLGYSPDILVGTPASIIGGALSGLAATGGDQIYKQALKFIKGKHAL